MNAAMVIDIELTEFGTTRKLIDHEARKFHERFKGKRQGQETGVQNLADRSPTWDKWDVYRLDHVEEKDGSFVARIRAIEPSFRQRFMMQRLPNGDFEFKEEFPGADFRKDDGSYYFVIEGPNTVQPPSPMTYAQLYHWTKAIQQKSYVIKEITEYPAKAVTLAAP